MPAATKKVNINLIVKEGVGESVSEQLLSWVLTYGRYIIIITQIIVLSVFFLRFKVDRDHTDLKEQVSQKQSILESMSEIEMEIRKLQTKLSHLKETTIHQNALTNVIQYLQENTPTDTLYSSLSLNKEKISLSASAGSLKSFSFLLRQFQNEKKFSEVTLESIQRRTDGRIEFKISAKINLKEFI